MADKIANVRRSRGTVHGHLTRIEWDIFSLEDKETLTPSDQGRSIALDSEEKCSMST